MARRSVLMMLGVGALVLGCVSVGTPPTTSAPVSVAPPPGTLTAATEAPATQQPIATPASTLPPEPTATPEPTTPAEATPEPTEEPERTLAPGETPAPSPLDLSEFLTSTMSVVNLTDNPVSASVDLYSDGEKIGTVAKLDIEPYGSLVQNVPAATYLVSITVGSADPVTCAVTIDEEGEVDFAVAGTDVLVTRPDVPPAAPDEIFIDSSPLCA